MNPARTIRDATRPFRRGLRKAVRRSWLVSLARANRARSTARFVAVTGSSAKSSTTALLGHILQGHAPTHVLAVENTHDPVAESLRKVRNDHRVAVFECGSGAKGDIRRLVSLVRPNVGIVTMVRIEHYSAFRSLDAIADEKADLVRALPADGLAILNADDEKVMAMTGETKARIVTFGQSDGANYRVTDVDYTFPGPLTMAIQWAGGRVELATGFHGRQFWLPAAAAFAAAVELGVPVPLIVERFASFKALDDRCEVMEIPGGPTFLLDTAKSPAHSLELAFRTMEGATAVRKTICMGTISDYSTNSRAKYRKAYAEASKAADRVIFVGETSHRSGASAADIESGRFAGFRTVRETLDHLRETAVAGELILLKGSTNLHMERIALGWTGGVRCWEERCGFTIGCTRCGLYAHPFEAHPGIRRSRRVTLRGRLAAAAKRLIAPVRGGASE